MNKEHNCMIPLVGGPCCGQSITLKDGRIPNSTPVFFEKKFYNYILHLEQGDFWTNVYYEYANSIQELPTK